MLKTKILVVAIAAGVIATAVAHAEQTVEPQVRPIDALNRALIAGDPIGCVEAGMDMVGTTPEELTGKERAYILEVCIDAINTLGVHTISPPVVQEGEDT